MNVAEGCGLAANCLMAVRGRGQARTTSQLIIKMTRDESLFTFIPFHVIRFMNTPPSMPMSNDSLSTSAVTLFMLTESHDSCERKIPPPLQVD